MGTCSRLRKRDDDRSADIREKFFSSFNKDRNRTHANVGIRKNLRNVNVEQQIDGKSERQVDSELQVENNRRRGIAMTLFEISHCNSTRKFRCRHALNLQDFLVLGPTKLGANGAVIRFSVLNLDTGNYNDLDATTPGYVLLSSNTELGIINRISEIKMLRAIRENYT